MTPTIDLRDRIGQINRLADHLPHDVVALAARIFPAVVFWQSARTKVDGLTIKDSTYFLFEQVYALPLIPPRNRRPACDSGRTSAAGPAGAWPVCAGWRAGAAGHDSRDPDLRVSRGLGHPWALGHGAAGGTGAGAGAGVAGSPAGAGSQRHAAQAAALRSKPHHAPRD